MACHSATVKRMESGTKSVYWGLAVGAGAAISWRRAFALTGGMVRPRLSQLSIVRLLCPIWAASHALLFPLLRSQLLTSSENVLCMVLWYYKASIFAREIDIKHIKRANSA